MSKVYISPLEELRLLTLKFNLYRILLKSSREIIEKHFFLVIELNPELEGKQIFNLPFTPTL